MSDQQAPSPAEFHVLLALADGPKHGHGIKVDVRDRTRGGVDMGPGTLYGAIKRLRRREWITEVDAPDGEAAADERRRYYAVTPAGLEGARAEAAHLATLVDIAHAKSLVG